MRQPIEITLQDADLGTIVLGANRSMEVAHREYMRLRLGFQHHTAEAIVAEGLRIVEALKNGLPIPNGDTALQIAAFYEHAVGTAVELIHDIQAGRGTGATVASLYLLLAQQTGFLMALDAHGRGHLFPTQLEEARADATRVYRQGKAPGPVTVEVRRLVKDNPELRNKPKALYALRNKSIVPEMSTKEWGDAVGEARKKINLPH